MAIISIILSASKKIFGKIKSKGMIIKSVILYSKPTIKASLEAAKNLNTTLKISDNSAKTKK